MNKISFVAAAFCAALMTALTVGAQTKSGFPVIVPSSETPTFDRNFAAGVNQRRENFVNNKRATVGEFYQRAGAEKAAVRQTAYVRPTKEARFRRYASDAFGVPALIGATFGAAFSQIGNNPPEWGKNIGGFGKRYASSYGTNAIRNTVSYGLSEAFKLDNRFEKSGATNLGKRLKHVFLGSYTTRTRTGRRIPDFPSVTGTYAASIIANETWYPNRFSYKDGIRDGTISLGVRFGVNLLREFVFSK